MTGLPVHVLNYYQDGTFSDKYMDFVNMGFLVGNG